MKGVVFNLLESFICEGWGDDTYEEILSGCPLHTREPFVGPGTYPDADLMTIAAATAERLDLELDDALTAFGEYCFPHLMARFPHINVDARDPLTFLKSVDGIVHVEVKKLMPSAVTPSFECIELDGDALELRYRSKRKLCPFATGLIRGLGTHFNAALRITHGPCLRDGADYCGFRVELDPRGEVRP